MAGSDKIYVTCERCARSIRVVVVDSEHEQLTAAEQAAVQVYEEWFERFDPEQDAYVHRCPDCVKHSDARLWIGIGDPEFADHTAPGYRRRDST
jgi:hypothetical protein